MLIHNTYAWHDFLHYTCYWVWPSPPFSFWFDFVMVNPRDQIANYIYSCIWVIKFWSFQTVLHNIDTLSSKLTLIIVCLPLIFHLSVAINLSIQLNLSSIKWVSTLTLREYKCLEAACLFETLWNSPVFLVLQISIGYLCSDSLKLLAFIIHYVRKAAVLMI